MHAHLRVIGHDEAIPERRKKPVPKKKKGPRISLLKRIHRLSQHSNQNYLGWCYAGNEMLAADYDTSTRSIRRWIAELESQGLIELQVAGRVRKMRLTGQGRGLLEDRSKKDPHLVANTSTGESSINDNLSSMVANMSDFDGHSDHFDGQYVHKQERDLTGTYVLATVKDKISPGSFEEVQKAFVGVAEGRVMFLHLPAHLEKILSRLFQVEFI